jgi:hypothetical protein
MRRRVFGYSLLNVSLLLDRLQFRCFFHHHEIDVSQWALVA